MSRTEEFEAIVIGGGPAGSTAGAVLAEHGRRVVVLEKDRFPRYHIGESLMPYCYFPLERIGVIEQIKQSNFPKKYSVQFVSTSGKVSQPFYFFQHLEHEAATTWQVVRSEFDQMLLQNARARGAEVREETRAVEILQENGTVVGVRTESGGEERILRAPITLDASGRDALAVARNGWRVPDARLKKIAVWTYYRGALRDPGLDEGATTVAYLPEKGWFWYIPLPDDVVSVGIVADREYLLDESREPAEIFAREIPRNPWIQEHLAPAQQFGRYWTTSEYSYRSQYCAADGLVLVGDAFAFLDPVFSSGVFLALRSGELAADVAHAALQAGDVSAERFREYGETVCRGIEAMRNLVYAFYDHEFSFRNLFMSYPTIRPDLTDCLIGNLFRDFQDLFGRVGEFARLPAPLPHGTPLPSCASSN
ncbi:MAG: NAD(P)/FAD-dependent oxidoreductase [Armatimonadetes bacterium]|nr:NAD(P)/FAD-dependent oxidoreductase [Armatimonadota bacterium]